MIISLKEQLKTIKMMKYQVPSGTDPFQLAVTMYDEIGAPDPELRDSLIYNIMAHWINEGVFTNGQLKELLSMLLSKEYLIKGLGQVGDQTLVRSFTILQIAWIVNRHNKEAFLSKTEIDSIFDGIMKVVPYENDLRGYDDQKGWFHIAAHMADLIDEMVYVKALDDNQILGLLKCIQFLIYKDEFPYLDFEEDRLAKAIVSLVKEKRVDIKRLSLWFEGFTISDKDLSMPNMNFLKKNVRSFLMSCYFQLKVVEGANDLVTKISDMIHEI